MGFEYFDRRLVGTLERTRSGIIRTRCFIDVEYNILLTFSSRDRINFKSYLSPRVPASRQRPPGQKSSLPLSCPSNLSWGVIIFVGVFST